MSLDSMTYGQLFAFSAAVGVGVVIMVLLVGLAWFKLDWRRHTRRGEHWKWDTGPLARNGTEFVRPGHWRGHWESSP